MSSYTLERKLLAPVARPALDEWQMVPTKPTAAMCAAYKLALKEYIERSPDKYQSKRNRRGMRVPEAVKIEIRWQAMLRAAPIPNGEAKQMGKQLDRLGENGRVFSVERLPDGRFRIGECDGYFYEDFTADELRELAAELVALSNGESRDEA